MTPFLEETRELERLVSAVAPINDNVRLPYTVARAVCTALELGRYMPDYWDNPQDAINAPVVLPFDVAQAVLERAKTHLAARVARELG